MSAINNVLTASELEHLAEVREVTNSANTAGWIRILRQMEKFVEEAHEEMFVAVYATDSIKANLQARWQQREAMLRGVKQYIEQCEAEKKSLLESFNERVSAPHAERDQEFAGWQNFSEVGDGRSI